MLAKYGFSDITPVSTLADSNVHLQRPLLDDDMTPSNFLYQSIVGSFLHVNIFTRPDISQATTTVSQYSNNFRLIHYMTIKRILKYLQGTTSFALCYTPNQHPSLITYVDANFVGNQDDRKSRSGCVILLNSAHVLWLSRKQPCMSTSTTKSEYVAACLVGKETVWLRRLLNDLGMLHSSSTKLLSDNQLAIRLVYNPKYHK